MKEYTPIAVFLFFLIVIFFLGIREKKRRREYLKQNIREQYGARHVLADEQHLGVVRGYYLYHQEDASIDDITWNDLEMDKIYGLLNHTCSFMGEEYLYFRLRSPSMREEELLRLEEDIRYYMERDDAREELALALALADKSSRFSIYDALGKADGYEYQKCMWVHILNWLLLAVSVLLLFVRTGAGLLLLIAAVAYSILTYFNLKAKLLEMDVVLREILRLHYAGRQVLSVLEKEDGKQRFYRPLKEDMDKLHSFTSGAAKILGRDGRGLGAGVVGMDYLNIIFHFDQMILERILPQLPAQKETVDGVFGQLGYLDFVLAAASYRKSLKRYCLPVFDGLEEAAGIYHPLLEEPVCNDYAFDGPVLLTGSNASGKSTFLRTVAVNMLLGQTIHTVCADRFHTGFHRLYTSMSLRDDLEAGDSYFMAEIKSMKRILDAAAADETTVYFIDEVLRGTNTIERISASTQILRLLAGRLPFGFAATHDIELTDILKGQYRNYHFSEKLEADKIVFDYLLKQGKSDTKNAISLLAAMGYEEEIVKKARMQADIFLKSGKWGCAE